MRRPMEAPAMTDGDAPADGPARADWRAISDFWRREIGPPRGWFASDPAIDAVIKERFEAGLEPAARGALDAWLDAPESALALVVLLDQFPRNIYRGDAQAFAFDAAARAKADAALKRGHDLRIEPELRCFFYLPFEHSENIWDQERGVALCEGRCGAHRGYAFHARAHRDLIRRFGRFPHRNAALGRASTPEEEAFLAGGGYNPARRADRDAAATS